MKYKNSHGNSTWLMALMFAILILLAACTPDMGAVVTPSAENETPVVPEQTLAPEATIQVTQPGDITQEPESTPTASTGSTLLASSDLWRGIGRININSTCTAVFVDSGGGDSAHAYILTNGHCIEWMANGAIANLKVEGEVVFNYFADAIDSQIAVPLDEVVYSTMQGIDIAIIRLDATIGELAA